MSNYKYLVTDPLRPHEPIVTDQKTVQPGRFNVGRTDNESLAQEIKERRPWAIVREYEDNNGQKSTRPTFTMPAMPWKYDRERAEQFAEEFNRVYQYLKEQHEKSRT